MNDAFIDGYMNKVALIDYRLAKDMASGQGGKSQADKTNLEFKGPHDEFFTKTPALYRKGIESYGKEKGWDLSWLHNPYKPTAPGWEEKWLPKSVYDWGVERKRKKLMKDFDEGNFDEIKQLYATNPQARTEIQSKAYKMIQDVKNKKIKEYATKALPWVAGGAGVIFLMTQLFRKKQQGASPQQIQALQNQIRQLQSQGRMRGQWQTPMRLNMVGNR